MNLVFRQNFTENPHSLLRRCGYVEILDRKTGKASFSRKLRQDHYPRFHVYITKEQPGFLQLNLHLDMKKPIYEGVSAHSGEYDGELVENEAKRVREIFEAPAPAAPPEEKKTFLGRLFNSGDED